MAKRTIRVTGPGIYGQPTDENPTGEYPIGHEFETESELPAGWAGRAEVVGDEPEKGSIFVTGEDDDSEVGKARREVIEKAEAEFARRDEQYKRDTATLQDRAERAEADLAKANEQIAGLTEKLKAFDHDGDGKPGGANGGGGEKASSDEIKAAIALLEPANDDHWTTTGLPAVDAVAELSGKSVTRDAIKTASPDAKRPA